MNYTNAYRQISADRMDHNGGCQGIDGSWESQGCEGQFLYGPYWNIGIGKYTGVIYLRRLAGSIHNLEVGVDVCVDGGRQVLEVALLHEDNLPFTPVPVFLDFEIMQPTVVEVRVAVARGALIAAHNLIIYQRFST
jgi:hypothetical protein